MLALERSLEVFLRSHIGARLYIVSSGVRSHGWEGEREEKLVADFSGRAGTTAARFGPLTDLPSSLLPPPLHSIRYSYMFLHVTV
jgi:hypothetical protein